MVGGVSVPLASIWQASNKTPAPSLPFPTPKETTPTWDNRHGNNL